MRFVATDEREITISMLGEALKQLDTAYSITREPSDKRESGILTHSGSEYGVIEINRLGDALFEEELGELKEFLEDVRGRNKKKVLQVLNGAKATIAVQVLWQDRTSDDTLSKIPSVSIM